MKSNRRVTTDTCLLGKDLIKNEKSYITTFVYVCVCLHLQGADVDTTCEEFEKGSALHIAATNLSVEAAKALLGFGADVQLTDELVSDLPQITSYNFWISLRSTIM